jgi:WD40 repeat protein
MGPEDVNSVAWSPDDDYLATAGLDKVVLVWDGHSFGKIWYGSTPHALLMTLGQ